MIHELRTDDVQALLSITQDGGLSLMSKWLKDYTPPIKQPPKQIQGPSTPQNGIQVSFQSTPSGAAVLVDDVLVCDETPCDITLPKGAHSIVYTLSRYTDFRGDLFAAGAATFSGELTPLFGLFQLDTIPSGIPLELDGVTTEPSSLSAANAR